MSDITAPNPDAEKDTDDVVGVEAAATAEEAAAKTSGAPEIPVAASPDTVFETPEVHELETEVNDEPVAAQKAETTPERVTEVPVYEVFVKTDERVDYVIVPPEGRGSALLPIHAFIDAETVEEVFAREASENQDEDNS